MGVSAVDRNACGAVALGSTAADTSHLPLRAETPQSTIEAGFAEFTERSDIAILLINQHVPILSHPPLPPSRADPPSPAQVADQIRPLVEKYTQAFPALLEIPSKDHPYDPSKDSVLKAVRKLFGDA